MGSLAADVTVVIPHFRTPGTLRRALASVAGQSVRPREVIVVDDASGNEAVRGARRAVDACCPSARMMPLTTNVGPGMARNLGWGEAEATWVAFLDADDEWHPRKIEVQMGLLDRYPSTLLSSHGMSVATGSTEGAGATIATDAPDQADAADRFEDISYRSLLLRNRVATSSVIVKRGVGPRFPVIQRHCEDYALWLALAYEHPVLHIRGELGTRHASPSGLSAQGRLMEGGELNALRAQAAAGRIPRVALAPLFSWSLAKYAVRSVGRTR
jgi:glycosyltransferase involved in cell wall biosynthesis